MKFTECNVNYKTDLHGLSYDRLALNVHDDYIIHNYKIKYNVCMILNKGDNV